MPVPRCVQWHVDAQRVCFPTLPRRASHWSQVTPPEVPTLDMWQYHWYSNTLCREVWDPSKLWLSFRHHQDCTFLGKMLAKKKSPAFFAIALPRTLLPRVVPHWTMLSQGTHKPRRSWDYGVVMALFDKCRSYTHTQSAMTKSAEPVVLYKVVLSVLHKFHPPKGQWWKVIRHQTPKKAKYSKIWPIHPAPSELSWCTVY